MAQTRIKTYMLFPNNKCFLYIQLTIADSYCWFYTHTRTHTHTHTHTHTNPGFLIEVSYTKKW